jgi:hypothetical protein
MARPTINWKNVAQFYGLLLIVLLLCAWWFGDWSLFTTGMAVSSVFFLIAILIGPQKLELKTTPDLHAAKHYCNLLNSLAWFLKDQAYLLATRATACLQNHFPKTIYTIRWDDKEQRFYINLL